MISQAVEDRMIERVESITDVTVHIDPEDDYDAPTCRGLPLRGQAMRELEQVWREQHVAQAKHEIRLHYLAGGIDVELILPIESYVDAATAATLAAGLRSAADSLSWFRGLRLLYG